LVDWVLALLCWRIAHRLAGENIEAPGARLEIHPNAVTIPGRLSSGELSHMG
jgi:hypothetical protein